MRFHIAARFHAFVNGLFRPPEERQTWFLYHRVLRHLQSECIEDSVGRVGLALRLAADLSDSFGLRDDHPHRDICVFIRLRYEDVVDPVIKRAYSE